VSASVTMYRKVASRPGSRVMGQPYAAQTKVSSTWHQRQSSPGSMDWTM
jgi:hypothetical protein